MLLQASKILLAKISAEINNITSSEQLLMNIRDRGEFKLVLNPPQTFKYQTQCMNRLSTIYKYLSRLPGNGVDSTRAAHTYFQPIG